jgi:hypothetical protein
MTQQAPQFDQQHQHIHGDQINVGHDSTIYVSEDVVLLAQVNAAFAQDYVNPGGFPDPNVSPYMSNHGHHHHAYHAGYSCSDTSHL